MKVVTAGTYEISVSRWPQEARHPITAPLSPGGNVTGASRACRAHPGVAVPTVEAVLRLNGREPARHPVTEEHTAITFTAVLPAGSHQLTPFFRIEGGGEIGAFYAVVSKK